MSIDNKGSHVHNMNNTGTMPDMYSLNHLLLHVSPPTL